MKNKTVKFIDLFAGLGGIRLGFEKAFNDAGMETECVMTSEIKPYAVKTLKHNFKNDFLAGDIFEIRNEFIPDFDFLLGGFPCQPFSAGGKRQGFFDTRGTLFFEIARVLKAKRPKYFLLENVKGLLNHDEGKTFRVILQTLEELGYEIQWMVLNSKFFGVPQNRERVFVIGSLRGEPRPEILPLREINQETDEPQISHTLPSSYHKITRGTTMIQESQGYRVYGTEGISPTLQGLSGG